jgi:hypothetical protein
MARAGLAQSLFGRHLVRTKLDHGGALPPLTGSTAL